MLEKDIISRMRGGYYVSKIQLRGNIPSNIMDFIIKNVKSSPLRDKKGFCRFEKVKGGIDIFVGNKATANRLAEQMKRQLKAELKRSYKLHTRRDSKNIYRDSISVRFT